MAELTVPERRAVTAALDDWPTVMWVGFVEGQHHFGPELSAPGYERRRGTFLRDGPVLRCREVLTWQVPARRRWWGGRDRRGWGWLGGLAFFGEADADRPLATGPFGDQLPLLAEPQMTIRLVDVWFEP